jgi:CrcB protein
VTVLWVALGGALGAPARYFLAMLVQQRRAGRFPWGTFAVNVFGSLLLGLVVGAGIAGHASSLVAVGLCGALTTYSTFSHETHRLIRAGHRREALLNVVGSMGATLAAVALGYLVGSMLG